MGKILVIKSLAASQLTYILAPHATNHEIIREINDLFYSYLWNNKGGKIKRSGILSEYEKGGLKMVDIATFSKSLKEARNSFFGLGVYLLKSKFRIEDKLRFP